MWIEIAHLQAQGINFVVSNADAPSHSQTDRQALLARLVLAARRNRLKIDKAALAFMELGRVNFFGTPDLVKYLASRGVPRWTHTLDV